MTRETEIPFKVKKRVWNRDDGMCILCGRPGTPNAHFISRAQGGRGIEENIVTLCWECHMAYDGAERAKLKPRIESYLKGKYKKWDSTDLAYHKWSKLPEMQESEQNGQTEKQ